MFSCQLKQKRVGVFSKSIFSYKQFLQKNVAVDTSAA
jgi:NAD+--asparagine ADP-ribosyltransferase